MYEEKINAYFDAPERRAELVEAISRLVRIRSVREMASTSSARRSGASK